ncbi:MAG: SAM-dependent methyltransferase [Acidobacteria bacterium]|nr:SAM-dependent methyltransferase [Acidobacteriota bacterium]MBV9070296.1 SAM-dependent methyltransferase [Acidobacteriota bacterium]MBV9185434.1 SAM-dependent methyltransferase [Acidobacteriota bacterium]
MMAERSMLDVLRKSLKDSDLPFHDFVELVLYHPEFGYYARGASPVGKGADYVTSPVLSPVFSYSLGNLCHEFMSRCGDGLWQVVDIGCGDGGLIRALAGFTTEAQRFFGVDRNLARAIASPNVTYVTSLAEIPPADVRLIISNELFDALPFARLVQRGEQLHELWVTEGDGALDWSEHEADARYEEYFAERGITLDDGQFADVSMEWTALYGEICRFTKRGLIVTFDYGLPQSKLFRGRMRRFGTAAAYAKQRVSRDLLVNPGQQDLTAHINFDDLRRTGEGQAFASLFFDIQAKFLLTLGATEHELFTPIGDLAVDSANEGLTLLQDRDDARRLILPDGIGADIRVLVQGRGMGPEPWRFQTKLF